MSIIIGSIYIYICHINFRSCYISIHIDLCDWILQGFAHVMVKLTQEMVEKWNRRIEDNGHMEVEVEESMIKLTADIIAVTQFGSSYKKGKKVFEHLEELKGFVIKYGHLLIIPGFRHVCAPLIFTYFLILKLPQWDLDQILGET